MVPCHRAYVSKGEGNCVLAAVIIHLCCLAEVRNPKWINVEVFPWRSKILASIAQDMKISRGKRCMCNMHLGCPTQWVHVDLPSVTSGTEAFHTGTCGKESEIGRFLIPTASIHVPTEQKTRVF